MYGESVYYNPEKFGLSVVAEIDDDRANYSFNTIVVWKHNETGKLYWAQDSGCSCPSPFEDYTSIEMLSKLRSGKELLDFMNSEGDYVGRSAEARAAFLRDVKDAMKRFTIPL